MPTKINMEISNNNHILYQLRAIQAASTPIISRVPSSLNAPFIARIHNVRPGCGSCGRK
jgi:hypothetical protein